MDYTQLQEYLYSWALPDAPAFDLECGIWTLRLSGMGAKDPAYAFRIYLGAYMVHVPALALLRLQAWSGYILEMLTTIKAFDPRNRARAPREVITLVELAIAAPPELKKNAGRALADITNNTVPGKKALKSSKKARKEPYLSLTSSSAPQGLPVALCSPRAARRHPFVHHRCRRGRRCLRGFKG